ncbi:unnamed protein product [Ceutorhynchus assimilis]|uniref:Tetraspanin n=1 Tax=Ceutorhynchus assimilis TaxID=467358 RepID=A0A9N9MWJ2_9CUCU|nr:unnamed protein product [Ceutorhynchus assimilis]
MLQTKNMTAEQRRNRKLKIFKSVMTVSCALIFCCGIFQSVELLTFCGRDFRTTIAFDSRYEQLCMTITEILLAIAGVFGIYWRKAGPVYIVAVSFLLCTTMVFHLVDFVMGIISMYDKDGKMEDSGQFLQKLIVSYKDGDMLSIHKLNGLQICKECCGIKGPEDKAIHSDDTGNGLIRSCCPDDKAATCTLQNAYTVGCANKLMEDEGRLLTFQAISVFTILCEFFTYQALLRCFV